MTCLYTSPQVEYAISRHCQGMSSIIPPELAYYIIDYLWGDPCTLLSCALTCRTWRDASRRHLRRGGYLDIAKYSEVDRVSRLLASKKTRGFYRDVLSLTLIDDKAHPFVHVLSLRLPGTHLPSLRRLVLRSIDWRNLKPHTRFFAFMEAFTSVKEVRIYNSRFSSAADLRRLVATFRRVEAVELNRTSVILPAGDQGVCRPEAHSTVKWLVLDNLRLNINYTRTDVLGSDRPSLSHPLLRLCCAFTSISKLDIWTCRFHRLEELRTFISSFPLLRWLRLSNVTWEKGISWSTGTAPAEEFPALDTLSVQLKSAISLDVLLDSFCVYPSFRTIRHINLSPCSPAWFRRALQMTDVEVRSFRLETAPLKGGLPIWCTYNFDWLTIRVSVIADTPCLHSCREAMVQALAQSQDIRLRPVELRIVPTFQSLISRPHHRILTTTADSNQKTMDAISARPVFSSVKQVIIDFALYPNIPDMDIKRATDEMRKLLWVWDARGILKFTYPNWHLSLRPAPSNSKNIVGSTPTDDAPLDDDDDWIPTMFDDD